MNAQEAPRTSTRAFVSAEWRYLAMLNYPIDPDALRPFTPRGTELDLWQGEAFVSLVGFLFLDTRVMGVPVPFHRNFEEVNLRFYVRHRARDEWRRGVVFVKEFVPRRAIAAVARTLYNENYVAASMAHSIDSSGGFLRPNGAVEYTWTARGAHGRLSVTTSGEAGQPPEDSHAGFIVEHYWGYARQRNGGTKEYRVDHPPWKVWASRSAEFEGDIESLYGGRFVECLSAPPRSAFVADGSPITVGHGVKLSEKVAREEAKMAPITEIEPTAPYRGRN